MARAKHRHKREDAEFEKYCRQVAREHEEKERLEAHRNVFKKRKNSPKAEMEEIAKDVIAFEALVKQEE